MELCPCTCGEKKSMGFRRPYLMHDWNPLVSPARVLQEKFGIIERDPEHPRCGCLQLDHWFFETVPSGTQPRAWQAAAHHVWHRVQLYAPRRKLRCAVTTTLHYMDCEHATVEPVWRMRRPRDWSLLAAATVPLRVHGVSTEGGVSTDPERGGGASAGSWVVLGLCAVGLLAQTAIWMLRPRHWLGA